MAPERPDPGLRDAALLLDMKLAAEDALRFVARLDEAAFMASDLHQSAAIRKLEVPGEAAGKLSPAFREAHPDIPWSRISGMRHRLIHNYGDVDLGIVWRVTTDELPPLTGALRPLVPPEAERDPG